MEQHRVFDKLLHESLGYGDKIIVDEWHLFTLIFNRKFEITQSSIILADDKSLKMLEFRCYFDGFSMKFTYDTTFAYIPHDAKLNAITMISHLFRDAERVYFTATPFKKDRNFEIKKFCYTDLSGKICFDTIKGINLVLREPLIIPKIIYYAKEHLFLNDRLIDQITDIL